MEYQLGANMKTFYSNRYLKLWRLCLECDSCVVFSPPVQSINQSVGVILLQVLGFLRISWASWGPGHVQNAWQNCQYARYMLLIQAHTKSHLVEKRLEKKQFKIKQIILQEECFHIIQAQENVIKRNTRTGGFHLKGVGIFTGYVRGVNLQILVLRRTVREVRK